MFKKLKLTQSGFSLIQGMILASAVAGMAFVGTKLLTDQKLAIKGQESKDKVESLHSMIYSILQNKDHCRKTLISNGSSVLPNFSGGASSAVNGIFTNTNASPIFQRNSNAGTTSFNPDLVYMNNSVSINNMTITMGPDIIKSATLDITYGKINSTDLGSRTGKGFGGKEIKKSIKLVIQTDLTTSAFESCYAVENDNEESVSDFCKSLTIGSGATGNELFFWDDEHQKCVMRNELCPPGKIYYGYDEKGEPLCNSFMSYLPTVLDTSSLNNCNPSTASSVGFVINGNQVSVLCGNTCSSSCDCPNAYDVCDKGSCVNKLNNCTNGTYARGDSSCQYYCNGGGWVCPVNPTTCNNNKTTCATSCDCPNPGDVCERGACVDRSAGGCVNGTYSRGDSSCQWLCNGGMWTCPVNPTICGTKANTCSTSCDCPNAGDVCEKGLCVDRTNGGCTDGTYSRGDSSCQWLCNGGMWTCPVNPTVCGSKANTCASSCDCPNAGDVCEKGTCVDRTSGGCTDGTYSRGDNSCQWLCNGGQWTCPANGQVCGAKTTCSSSCDCLNGNDVCEKGVCVDRTTGCVDGTLARGDNSCQWLCNGGMWTCPVNGQACNSLGCSSSQAQAEALCAAMPGTSSSPMISFDCIDQAAASGGSKTCFVYDVIGKDRCSMGILCSSNSSKSCLPDTNSALNACVNSGGTVIGDDANDVCLSLMSTDPTISCLIHSWSARNVRTIPCSKSVICKSNKSSCASSCDCPNSGDVCEKGSCVDRTSGCIDGTYAKGDSSCQWLCNGGQWTCALGAQACTNQSKSCTSSCDCSNPGDVCEKGFCVDRTIGCTDGTYAKGDNSCRWLCQSGNWSCDLYGQACGKTKGVCSFKTESEAKVNCSTLGGTPTFIEDFLSCQKRASGGAPYKCFDYNDPGACTLAIACNFSNSVCKFKTIDEAKLSCASSGGTVLSDELTAKCNERVAKDPSISCLSYTDPGGCTNSLTCQIKGTSCQPNKTQAAIACTSSGGTAVGDAFLSECQARAQGDPTLSCIAFTEVSSCDMGLLCQSSPIGTKCKANKDEAAIACTSTGRMALGSATLSECQIKVQGDPTLSCIAYNGVTSCDMGLFCQSVPTGTTCYPSMDIANSACSVLNGMVMSVTDINSCQSQAATYPVGLKCLGYDKQSPGSCDGGVVCKLP